jgi:Tfp pilus assembly protein PilE
MSIKDKTAVTTLELIIVIVIIAILAAIAVPVYTNRIERMRGERAIANIQLIAIAYKQYYVRNNQAPGILGSSLFSLWFFLSKVSFKLKLTNSTYSSIDKLLPSGKGFLGIGKLSFFIHCL